MQRLQRVSKVLVPEEVERTLDKTIDTSVEGNIANTKRAEKSR